MKTIIIQYKSHIETIRNVDDIDTMLIDIFKKHGPDILSVVINDKIAYTKTK